jgi:hypothetical protein
MNTIAIVTLVFLPGTLVCVCYARPCPLLFPALTDPQAIFSTVFFDSHSTINGADVLQYSPRIWIFFAHSDKTAIGWKTRSGFRNAIRDTRRLLGSITSWNRDHRSDSFVREGGAEWNGLTLIVSASGLLCGRSSNPLGRTKI